jgi:hypothetical protein
VCCANLEAKQQGFGSFAEYAKAQPKSNKDHVPFVETDRYIRGKVLDVLRERSVEMEELQTEVLKLPKMTKVRFARIIEDLVTDGLIHIHGTLVALPRS